MAPINTQRVIVTQMFGLLKMINQREIMRQTEVAVVTSWYMARKQKMKREYRKKKEWVYASHSEYWEKSVPLMDNERFKKKYRVSRQVFDYLVQTLTPVLKREDTKMRKSISVDKRIAIAIHCLKSGADYDTIAQAYGVGVSTVSTILHEFCEAVATVLGPKHVKLPTEDTDLKDCVEGFERRWNFPGTTTALDSTHIPIVSPPVYPEDYFNYKGWKSIHCLALVDYKYRFRFVHIGAPGKNNDGAVFGKSSLSDPKVIAKMCPPEKDYHIISDGAFKLEKWLMKPFPEHAGVNDVQVNFNYRLSRARMVVECAYGRLKGRWKILQKRCDVKLRSLPNLVYACVVLHNICQEFQDEVVQSWIQEYEMASSEFEQPPTIPVVDIGKGNAVCKRNALANKLFNDSYHQQHLSDLDEVLIRLADRQRSRNHE